jgi:hypothetical protein
MPENFRTGDGRTVHSWAGRQGIVLLAGYFVDKSADSCAFAVNYAGLEGRLRIKKGSQTGRNTFLASYNHSGIEAEFRGSGFIQ